jgi:hypothetical protein
MVSGRQRTRVAAQLGATWGLGHSAALLAVASALTVGRSALRTATGNTFEVLVGVMLLGLGAWRLTVALRRADAAGRPVAPTHRHAPFWVGIVHGLAGSGALTALAASEVSSPAGRIAYVAVFGLGSIAGMMALSGLAGHLVARLARRPSLLAALGATTGALTFALGLAWLLRFA